MKQGGLLKLRYGKSVPTPFSNGLELLKKTEQLCSARGHTPDDISVFDVWHISTVDMYFDISARILAYQWTFGISARILAYQPGFWHITRAPFRHLAYQKQQWEALRFDFVKHTGKRCLVPRR